MKKALIIMSLGAMVLIAGCSKSTTNPDALTGDIANTGIVASTGDIPTSDNAKKGADAKITVDQKAMWQGEKVGGTHSGTVAILPESIITVNSNNILLGGKVIIAMSTILESQTGTGGVTEHLMKEDFFDVANYPTTTIVAKSVSGNIVTADLTIRGITKELSFPVTLVADGDALLLSAELTLPLKDFNVGQTLLGKVALKDTFIIKLDKVAFMK